MIKGCKICGISDHNTLNFIVNHYYPPSFIGFICNYKKSKRYVDTEKLKDLLNINRKKSMFVSVLVNPDNKILEKLKHFKFDYYQLYDCSPERTKFIKNKYRTKIITAVTIKEKKDVEIYKSYQDVSDIYLFDSAGYDKSLSFDHSLIKKEKFDKEVMIAGNIKIDDNLENFKEIADIIDISGGLETSGLKDFSKIEIFLNKIKNLKNEY